MYKSSNKTSQSYLNGMVVSLLNDTKTIWFLNDTSINEVQISPYKNLYYGFK
jgi:hypothetical protein